MGRKLSFIVLLLSLISGCASQPMTLTPEESAKANFGPYPADYQERTKRAFENVLKDPYSAVYDFPEQPRKARMFRGLVHGGGHDYGYACNVGVNAKNSFGGYVGKRYHTVFFFNNGTTSAGAGLIDYIAQ